MISKRRARVLPTSETMSARFKVRPCWRGWQRASTAWSRLAAGGRGASEREVLGFGNASRFGAPTAAMLSPTAPASGTTWVQHPCTVKNTAQRPVSARQNRKLARRALGHWWLTGGREELRAGWCCRCCTFSGDRQPAKREVRGHRGKMSTASWSGSRSPRPALTR